MTNVQRPRVVVRGDDLLAAQIIARGVPGYDVTRAGPCDLVHVLGDGAVPQLPEVPVLVTGEDWHPGVDLRRFNPGRARGHEPLPGRIAVLHAGERPELLGEALLLARGRDERVHLIAGSDALAEDDRAATFARADIVVAIDAPQRTVLEAQASGVAVIAAGTSPLVRDGHTGLRCQPDRGALAAAILALAADAAERARLGRAGRYSTRPHATECALARLAALYDRALTEAQPRAAAA